MAHYLWEGGGQGVKLLVLLYVTAVGKDVI